jgi:acetyl-CoA C-acetyltransferase
MAEAVLERALAMAGLGIGAIGPIDIYSCFPCAVSAIAEPLGLPDDGSRTLTVTGGLPFFGGPGNEYSMHAIAEMVQRLRRDPQSFGLVTANGGMLSKHAAGIYSCQPGSVDWSRVETSIARERFARKPLCAKPAAGRIVSWTVHWRAADPAQATALAETDDGERFVACTAEGDLATVHAMLAADPTGRRIAVSPAQGETLHFALLGP